MRRYIDLIIEAARVPEDGPQPPPVTTKTRDEFNLDFDFMPELERGGPLTTTRATSDVALPGRKARRKPRRVQVEPETAARMATHLGSLPDIEDEISDAEAARHAGVDVEPPTEEPGYVEPATTENLPAVIRHEVALTGDRISPEWYQVKNLPGYMKSAIRAMGRSVFRQFTDTPIEDIQVLTTLGNLNPEHDVVGMMNWIRRNGVQDDTATLDFEQTMPGYSADVTLWRTKDYSFLLVRDFAGHYIYGFQGGREHHLTTPVHRRLR